MPPTSKRPKPDVSDVEAILERRTEHANIWCAQLEIAREFPSVPRDGSNPRFNSHYSTYDVLISTLRPVLAKHGCVVTHELIYEGESVFLDTRIVHTASETDIGSRWRVRSLDDGPQAIGSELTYAKRYSLGSLLAVATEADDDGNAAQTEHRQRSTSPNEARPASEKQIKCICALFRKAGYSDERRRDAIRKTSNSRTSKAIELSSPEASRVIDRLKDLVEGQEHPLGEAGAAMEGPLPKIGEPDQGTEEEIG